MPEPTGALLALRASTADLLRDLEASAWSDAEVAAASLCAGWTRGHVLTHLARNADGIAATLSGALRGEVVARYPGGQAGRDAAIAAGAGRAFGVLVADVRSSAERLDRVLGAVHDAGAWDAVTDEHQVAADWVFARLREVEVHHVDLAAGYSPRQWPPLLVRELLPELAESLAARTTRPLRLTVAGEGSVVPELAGKQWTTPGAPADEVTAPDWALLAWLTGRSAAAVDALPSAPALPPCR